MVSKKDECFCRIHLRLIFCSLGICFERISSKSLLCEEFVPDFCAKNLKWMALKFSVVHSLQYVGRFRLRPHVSVFVWKRNYFSADWPSSTRIWWKQWPKTLSRVEVFENAVLVLSCGRWKRNFSKTITSQYWMQPTPRERMSEYFVWRDSQSTVSAVLETLYSIVNLKRQLHFVICPKKRASLANFLKKIES